MQKAERTKSPDLEITYLNRDRWKVVPVSLRARGWLVKRVLDDAAIAAEKLETDLPEINRLAASARTEGLCRVQRTARNLPSLNWIQ
jgi:hypothetical protein